MRIRKLTGLLLAAGMLASAENAAEDYKQGHSHYGQAYDAGPRQKPWMIEGIGQAPFPISTSNPEVQKWFDQGNALLHSFWYYEAERAFRWARKLEPENPMVYWGLARAADGERSLDFIREAVKRRDKASERERLYIDGLAAQLLPDPLHEGDGEYRSRQAKKYLETLCVKYPDDVEARALLALSNMGGDRYGTELIIREILAKRPDHPGAHHYRIHNWDYHEPEQALGSSRRYGEIVPGIGHALHMPGHIFSIVGMWNEAAISMDAATRAEKRYMKDSLTFPFNNWNYGHNRNYLSYIQEQLGMPSAAIFGARQLIDAPADPKDNNDAPFTSQSYGIAALTRALIKYERWDELLDPKTIPWRNDLLRDKAIKAYVEARAYFGKNDVIQAEKAVAAHAGFAAELEKDKKTEGRRFEGVTGIQATELKARLAIARGETIMGLGLLAEAAQKEAEMQKQYADPPIYPEVLYNALGEAYLKAKSPRLAIEAFGKALDLTKNDLFALSGLVRACTAAGDSAKAKDAMGRLLFVASDAEPGLAILNRAKAAGIEATPLDSAPGPQRNYLRTSLEKYGPNKWEPYMAPLLDVKDAAGKRVTLEEYRGKNVLLVFYLGEECPHCMRQLHDIGKRKDEWAGLDTTLLAVSSALPKKNAAGVKALGELPFRLLSDEDYGSARRFHSYDDFEEIELHSTILIDKKGRVYWARLGGDPFGDTEFLKKQLERMNELVGSEDGDRKTAAVR
jgi:peroxiredoxin/tetratricopeptide (TPR) repeat protein